MSGCLKALVVAGVIGAVAVVGMVVLVALVGDEVEDRTRTAGRDNGVEITLEEFDRIENGMTLKEVERLIGGPGALASSSGELHETYTWDGDRLAGFAVISFDDGRVNAKQQVGL